ncbi:MAG: GtrA family protein [Myxococcaceae bacterium]
MVGAAATLLDIVILLICVKLFGTSNRIGAMVGVFFGSTFTFFANRHFAFRDHKPAMAPQALKFVTVTAVSMLIHGQLVHVLSDNFGVPVVLSKMAADVAVFSVGQLLVLRYIVFPKWKPKDVPASEPVRQLVEEAQHDAELEVPAVQGEEVRRSA